MNILFILADALRPDHLRCYGYPKDTSPNIDRLAREGVRFENCVAVSAHTVPPLVSMLTGQDTITHGLMTAQDYGIWVLEDTWRDRRTSLHVLKDKGYLVDGEFVMRWRPLGFARDQNDLAAYAQENRDKNWFYFASPYPTHLPYNPPQEYYEMFVDKDFHPSEGTRKRMKIAQTTMLCHPPGVKGAMEVGQKDAIGEPDDAHKRSADIVEFAPEDAPGIRALYDGEVRIFDDWIGKQIAKLEELNLLDDTFVLLVADHGEELLERGHIGHTSCNLMGTLFDECVRVPLIMRYPKAFPAGKVIRNQVSQIDIMPTLFDLLGWELPPPVDGLSLLPLIRGETDRFREEAYSETPPAGWQRLLSDERWIRCVRTLEWKLIQYEDPSKNSVRYELYNLREDPGERNDIIAREPDKADELKAKLVAHMKPRKE